MSKQQPDPFWRAHAAALAAKAHTAAMCKAHSAVEKKYQAGTNPPELQQADKALSDAFHEEDRARAHLARTPTYGAEQARALLEIASPLIDDFSLDRWWHGP